MGNESNKCYNCKYLDRYYTKGTVKFNKTKLGWCSMKAEIVNYDGGCECHQTKSGTRHSHGVLKRTLNDVLTEISEIRKILEIECGEREEL